MIRSELATLTLALVEDASGKTFTLPKVHAHLNLAASYLTSLLSRKSIIRYDLGLHEFNSTMIVGPYPVSSPERFLRPVQLYCKTAETLRGVLIPEGHKDRVEYRVKGYCGSEFPYFIRHNPDSFVNCQQTLASASGTYTLSFDGSAPSAVITHPSTVSAVQAAIDGLATIDPGDVVVSGTPPNYTLTFGARYAGKAVPLFVSSAPASTTIEYATEGSDSRLNIYFVTAPGTGATWVFRFQKHSRVLAPGDTSHDLLTYDTIQDAWHYLIAYRAAITLLGLHNDNQAPIVEDYKSHLAECLSSNNAAQPIRRIRRTSW